MKVAVVESARLYKAKACLANCSARHAFVLSLHSLSCLSLTASVYCDVIRSSVFFQLDLQLVD